MLELFGAQQSYKDQLKRAIEDKKPNDVLRILPYLQHRDRIQCNVRVNNLDNRTTAHTTTPYLCPTLAIVQLLITAYNCSPLQKDKDNYIALHYAALGGHLDFVKYFIHECNIDPMSEGRWRIIPLHLAAYSGESLFRNLHVCTEMKLKTVKYLIEQCN